LKKESRYCGLAMLPTEQYHAVLSYIFVGFLMGDISLIFHVERLVLF